VDTGHTWLPPPARGAGEGEGRGSGDGDSVGIMPTPLQHLGVAWVDPRPMSDGGPCP
jgi:hypothetical protein